MTLRCSQQMLGLLSKTKMDQEINQALVKMDQRGWRG
jgi:hypothetical protein